MFILIFAVFLSVAWAGTASSLLPPLPDAKLSQKASAKGGTPIDRSYEEFIALAMQDPAGSPSNLTPEQSAFGVLIADWVTKDDKVPNSGGTVFIEQPSGCSYRVVDTNVIHQLYSITKIAVGTGVSGVVSLGVEKTNGKKVAPRGVALKEQFFSNSEEVARVVRETGIQMVLMGAKPKVTMDVYRAWVGPRPTTGLEGYPANRPNLNMGQRADVSMWIAMEQADTSLESHWGCSSKPSVKANPQKCPDLESFTGLLQSIAKRYETMHQTGVEHRDLKMDNIMMKDGEAYPIDFGLSRPIVGGQVKTDAYSFGKMILDFSKDCFAKTFGQSSDPVIAAIHPPPTFPVPTPNNLQRYISKLPNPYPNDYPLWRRVLDMGIKYFATCAGPTAQCRAGIFKDIALELGEIGSKIRLTSLAAKVQASQ